MAISVPWRRLPPCTVRLLLWGLSSVRRSPDPHSHRSSVGRYATAIHFVQFWKMIDSQTPAEVLSIVVYNSTAECCTEAIHCLLEAEWQTASGDITTLAASNMFFYLGAQAVCPRLWSSCPLCRYGKGPVMGWDIWDGTAVLRYATLDSKLLLLQRVFRST